MPDVPPPESLPTEQQRFHAFATRIPNFLRDRMNSRRPMELRYTDPDVDPLLPPPRPPLRAIWMRAACTLPDDPALHACLLAYASDSGFVTTALLPHGVSWLTPGMQVASLDHAMWFHHPFRVDQWLLHSIDSPAASGARGLVRGRIFTRDGKLVASTAQEGLLRQHARPPSTQCRSRLGEAVPALDAEVIAS
ncbi:MAG: thioesterase family protein [Myxococcales bacterium]|nr:thioesterase family protein [Myxococcales bacterium]